MTRFSGTVQTAMRLALFPGAWLLALALLTLRAWTFSAILTWSGAVGFVTALLAGAAYVAGRPAPEMRRTSTAQIVVLWPIVALCMWPVTIVAVFVTTSFYGASDLIDTADDNFRAGDPCNIEDNSDVSNGAGMVAAVGSSACPIGWGADYRFFVFVRPSAAENARSNLVFRDIPGDQQSNTTTSPVPRVTWLDNRTLSIAISDTGYQIEKQLYEIGDVQIRYEIHPERTR